MKIKIKREGNNTSGGNKSKNNSFIKAKLFVAAVIPLIVLVGMVIFLFGPGQTLLNAGITLPDITIERIEFHEGRIVALIRNTGPETIDISQADVNDRISAAAIEPSKTLTRFAEAKVIIPFNWNEGIPYEIGITTSDGTRFSKSVEAAALAPTPNVEQILYFAIIGTYVGIIPVLIGLLWYPFIKKLSLNKYNFFLSLTAGLLVFLGIDALVEGTEITQENVSGSFDGLVLIAMVTIISFLSLLLISEKLVQRASSKKISSFHNSSSEHTNSDMSYKISKEHLAKPVAVSLMISIGIGFHNFGEGLAIGAAVLLGQVSLSTFLIVGFTLHNTTEGLAIVAPMAKSGKLMIRRLLVMGLIAGAPAIIGTWIGGFMYSPLAAIIFLAIGAGAIFQVVFAIASMMSSNNNNREVGNKEVEKKSLLNTAVVLGFIVGMAIMYLTSLLIPS